MGTAQSSVLVLRLESFEKMIQPKRFIVLLEHDYRNIATALIDLTHSAAPFGPRHMLTLT